MSDSSSAVEIKWLPRIKELAEAKGMSLAELARRADLTRPHVSKIAHGKHKPSMPTARKLARALDVRVDDLFEEAA